MKHDALPPRFLSLRWSPWHKREVKTLRYKLNTGLLRSYRMMQITRAAEKYWKDNSSENFVALNDVMDKQGAWLMTPSREYNQVMVFDPVEAAEVAGDSKERLFSPAGVHFAHFQKAKEALFRKLNGKRVIGVLAGGIGDLIMFSQLCRALMKKYDCTIDIGSYRSPQPDSLLAHLYAPSAQYRFPLPESQWQKYDYILPLGLYRVLNGESLMAYFKRCFDLDFAASGFDFDIESTARADRRLVHRFGFDLQKPLVFVQGGCRPEKNYPHFDAVATALADRGFQVAVIGDFGNSAIANEVGRIANLCGWSVWDTICAMRHAALVITPDSSFMHAAGALDKPAIALFGPTPPFWSEPYPKTTALVFTSVCRFLPCWCHSEEMPPCGLASNRPCLTEIPQDFVIEQALAKLEGKLTARWIDIPRIPKQYVTKDVSC